MKPTSTMKHPAAVFCGVALALFSLALTGCDFGADEETITLQDNVLFRFVVEADDLAAGESFTAVSSTSQSVENALADQGYALDQLISARITGGIAELLFPLDATVSFLDEVSVRLSADTTLTGVVANRLDIVAEDVGDTLDLTAFPSVDAGPVLRFEEFYALLDLVSNDRLSAGETYEFAVQLDLSMDVLFQ